MKKSKIIVPALGLLLLSTAASVSGTVAWFTANRTYNNTISNFSVGEIDGNLSVSGVANIVGTTVNNDSATSTVSVDLAVGGNDSVLADASWEYDTGILYTDDGSATNASTGVNTSSFISLGDASGSDGNEASKWKVSASATNYMYYAVSYSMTFAYDFTNDDHSMNLFIDLSSTGSTFTKSTKGNSDTGEIAAGLRIGFSCTAQRVLAPFQGTAANVTCVDTTTTTKAITSPVLSNSSTGAFNVAKAKDAEANQTTRADYLGTFVKTSAESLTVKVVVWLEGTDTDVKSGATWFKNTFGANMKFYCARA